MPRRFFISCVTAEFGPHRRLLTDDLRMAGVDVTVQEDFPIGEATLLAKLDRTIQGCDAVIHLIGDGTGSFPSPVAVEALRESLKAPCPDLTDRFPELVSFLTGTERLSLTQWEAWLALIHRKPLFVVVAETVSQGPQGVSTPEASEQQRSHRERLKNRGHDATARFLTPEDLCRKILASVNHLLPEQRQKPDNLPASLGDRFIGREAVLQQLREKLTRGTKATAITPRQAIHGMGGVGKTQLAVEYGRRFEDDYSALFYIVADSPTAPFSNLAQLSQVLDLPEQHEKEDDRRFEAVIRWLQNHPGWYLILDNVDSDDSAQVVIPLLNRLRGGHVVLTSRLANWSALFESFELDVLDTNAGVDLLLTLGRRPRTPDEEAAARAVVDELGGLALALTQAAAYVHKRRISFARYREEWQKNSTAVLEWHDPRTMTYPRSVAVTLEMSVRQLSPSAGTLLELLAWMAPEPIPRTFLTDGRAQSILKVARKIPDVEEALIELADLSLARLDEETIQFHRLVQEITRSRLTEDQSRSLIRTTYKLLLGIDDLNDPYDTQAWPQWNLFVPHIATLVRQADRLNITASTADWMNKLGQFLSEIARYKEAEEFFRRALKIRKVSLRPRRIDLASSLNNLAYLLEATNRWAEAEPLFRQALEILEAGFGLRHPYVASSLSNLAYLLDATNRRAEAEPLFRRALEIREANDGPHHPAVASTLNNLARFLEATNRHAEAEPLFRRALEIREASLGPHHRHVAESVNNLAYLLDNTSRQAEAEPLYRRALEIWEKCLGPHHPDVVIALNNLATLLRDLNRWPEAEQLFLRALSIREARLEPQHRDVGTSLLGLAKLFRLSDRLTEAEPLIVRALEISRQFQRDSGQEYPQRNSAIEEFKLVLQARRVSKTEIEVELQPYLTD